MVQLVKSQADLYAFVRSLMPFNAADVDDVVQDANVALVKRAEEYDPSRPFRTWLFTFARLQVLKFFTLRKREPLVFDNALAEQSAGVWNDVLPGGTDANSTANLLKNLARCRERLSPRQRELLEAYYLRSEPLVAIAERRHANAHTLSTLLGYIRKKLGDCIRRQCRLDDAGDTWEPTPEESLLNDVLADPDGNRHEADRLRESLKSPALLRYWCEQSLVHALLAYECSETAAAPLPAREPKPWWRREERLAAAAVILLLAGLAVAAVIHFTAGGQAEKAPAAAAVPVESEPVPAAAVPASAAMNAAAPAAAMPVSSGAATNVSAATTKEGATMKVKSVAAAAAVAVAAVAPPAVTQATEPAGGTSAYETCLTDRGWLETRDCAEDLTGKDWLETRLVVIDLTAGRQTWCLSTVSPAGTVYRFF